MTNLEKLKKAVEWLEAHPELVVPYSIDQDYNGQVQIGYFQIHTMEAARPIISATEFTDKIMNDRGMPDHIRLIGHLPGGIGTTLVLIGKGETCTRRLVRTEEIPERVILAHTNEIYEWDCPESILEAK